MKFENLLETEIRQLDEMAIAKLSGSVDAFSQRLTYETSESNKVYTTTVWNSQGKVGEIVFSNPDRLVYFLDEYGSQVKVERLTGSRPSRLDSYYVPELMARLNSNELF